MSIDLFKAVVAPEKQHPLFKLVLNEPAYKKTHEIINSWGQGLLERRGEATKFVIEFQTTFNSSFWELYLNQAFKDLGYDIDYSKASPDFNLINKKNCRAISVEAVTSNPREIEELELKTLGDDFLDESTLKLAGKIRDKHLLYIGDGKKKHPYSSLTHVQGNAFVLAVAPFDKNFTQAQNNTAINRVLYGLEPPESSDSKQRTVEFIPNKNGKNIDLGIFTNDSYKEISAVIFSTTGTFSKAIVKAGTANFIRCMRLRKMSFNDFLTHEGSNKLGRSINEISEGYTVFSERRFDGVNICGHDMYLYDAHFHKETHLDGLQIYHNPFAMNPLKLDDFNSPEIVHYHYDVDTGEMHFEYNDLALVSRNTVSSFA